MDDKMSRWMWSGSVPMSSELRRVGSVHGFQEIVHDVFNWQMRGLIPADYRPTRETVSILMGVFTKCGLSPRI